MIRPKTHFLMWTAQLPVKIPADMVPLLILRDAFHCDQTSAMSNLGSLAMAYKGFAKKFAVQLGLLCLVANSWHAKDAQQTYH